MKNKLEAAMRQSQLDQTALALKMGVSPQAVQQWVSGKTVPKGQRLSKLAAVLGVSIDWLVNENNKEEAMTAPIRPAPDRDTNLNLNILGESNVRTATEYPGRVPLIRMTQVFEWCSKTDNFTPADNEGLLCPAPHGRRTYAVIVEGDSMIAPFPGMKSYSAGTIIFIDPDVEPTSGKRVIAVLPNTHKCTFREYRVVDGRHYLAPLNTRYDMIEVDENVQFFGVVVFAGMGE